MKPISVPVFAVVAASPLAMLLLACLWGGVWVWAALAYMALATVAVDSLLPWAAGEAEAAVEAEAGAEAGEFPAADMLLAVLAIGALLALPVLVRIVAGPGDLGLGGRLALFLAGGLWFGQVAHPAAHELIHRRGRLLYGLGVAVYAVLLFGHHASAHRLVHHRDVASGLDPNSARLGEGYYRFLARAWPGSIRAGFAAERALRGGHRLRGAKGLNPYGIYAGGAVQGLGLGFVIAGWPGLLVWAAFGLHFGAQVLLSDYVQHYGLTRAMARPGAKLEPVGLAHSWNAPHWFSSALMLNATRHSDHHGHPARAYPALQLAPGAPMLPWPLPVACLVALFPPRWRRVMQPLVAGVARTKP